jgi:Flp pilus assembly protein TadD
MRIIPRRMIFLFAPLWGLTLLSSVGCSGRSRSAAAQADRLNDLKIEARTLIGAGDHQGAVAILEALSREAPEDPQVLAMLGESYAGLGRMDDAVGAYDRAIRLSYTDYRLHLGLARVLMTTGKTGRALTEFEIAVEYGAHDAVALYDYGLALHAFGRERDALAQWRRAFELDGSDPRYAEAVGIGLYATGDPLAVQYFERARELGARSAGFHNNYGQALERAGRFTEAASQLEEAVTLAPDTEAYRFNLAALYMRSGRYEAAIGVWDLLVSRFGPRWSYLVYRGRTLLELGRSGEAAASAGEAVAGFESGALEREGRLDRTPPGLGEALEVLAMSYRGRGELQKAREAIERALSLEPRNVSFLNNYGVILAANGMIADAKAQWRKVLEIDGENEAAKRNLSALER